QKKTFAAKVQHYQSLINTIGQLVDSQRRTREAEKTSAPAPAIAERDIEPMLVAAVRLTGAYAECGKGFATLGRKLGRHIAGKPLWLFNDGEFREGDADFEPCIPIRQPVEANGFIIHQLPAARCATLVHRGPYDELKNSYARLFKHVKERGLKMSL